MFTMYEIESKQNLSFFRVKLLEYCVEVVGLFTQTPIFSIRFVFGIFFIMNLILWGEGSSAAIPFGTLVAILALWFGISVPLTFVGAYIGYKKPVSCEVCMFVYFYQLLIINCMTIIICG